MDLDLTGRHALVCGSSDGIGRAAAHELALLGADVTVLARRGDVLQAVVAALPSRGRQTHGWIAADLAAHDHLLAEVGARIAQRPVQILVNNSGGPPGGPIASATPSAFLDAFQRHLVANQLLAQAVAPGMRAAGWGRIVNVVSTSIREPIAGLGVSNTIRGAVASWAKTLSRELAGDNITVNNVLPGYTRTARIDEAVRNRVAATGRSTDEVLDAMRAQIPLGRIAEPAEIAAAIAFLCSPAAGYITGTSLPVDGGRMASI